MNRRVINFSVLFVCKEMEETNETNNQKTNLDEQEGSREP